MLLASLVVLLQAQTTPYLVLPRNRPAIYARSSSSTSSSSLSPRPPPASLPGTRADLITMVNQERRKRGLSVLKEHPLLTLAAQGHAEDMAARGFFAHRNPDGESAEDRIRETGYFVSPCASSASEGHPEPVSRGQCVVRFAYGENIGKGQKTPRDVMRAWMQSAIHRGNILKTDVQDIGIGFSGGFWVQTFSGVRVERK